MKKVILLFFTLLISCNSTGKLTITDAWFRPVVKGMNTALYFKIENDTDKPDTLYKISSQISGMVHIHETFVKDDMKGMRPVKYIVIKPHSKIEFKPGGYHVMVMNVKEDFNLNSSAEFILYFKQTGKIKITTTANNYERN
ncbi:MAG: copper chaperone PCu(A)C [Bacteroidetes bacterium]|nr:copper chaperone PCu(A)C [Bacteroidota bacterium]